MLWYKLCILVILLNDNAFGYWAQKSKRRSWLSNLNRGKRTRSTTTLTPIDLVTKDIYTEYPTPEDLTTEESVTATSEESTSTPKIVITSIENTFTSEEITITEEITATDIFMTEESATKVETTTSEKTTTTGETTIAEEITTTEETTTTEEITTTEAITTTEETTTTEEPTPSTESPAMCNASLHTKEDLLLIYNYIEKGLLIHEKIINSFHSEAESVRDKHVNKIAAFQKLFQDKPVHLKHILQDISDTRHRLLPYVEEFSKTLNQYPELLNQFKDNQEGLSKLFNNFERQKKICVLSCDTEVYVQRESIFNQSKEVIPYDKHEFYCGSIGEVRAAIQFKLSNFSENQQRVLKNRLDFDNDKYTSEIEQLKMKLKDIAVRVFGYTMYDVLELQDAYFHFSEDIKTGDIKSTLDEVKHNIAQIKPKALSLEVAVQKLIKHCRACSNNFVSRLQSDATEVELSLGYDNILDELMYNKLQSLEKDIMFNYTSMFEVLVKTIEEANSTNAYIDDIKPIQDDVMAATREEFEELAKLKLMIPTEHRQGLLDLAKQSKSVLEKIDETINFIEYYTKRV